MDTTHAQLIQVASKWLKKNGHENCPIVITEQACAGNKEIVDVIGFNHLHSVMIEVKVSRSDFLKDKKKIYRINQDLGVGNFRFYLTTPGTILPEDLPEKWGLLYYTGKKIEKVVNPFFGNINSKSPNKFNSNLKEERSILYSGFKKQSFLSNEV